MPERRQASVAGRVRATPRAEGSMSPNMASSVFAANVNPAVKTVFSNTVDLPTFRQTPSQLTREERLLLLAQARVLIEQNYVHLPLKKAMHAVDPIQRLRLLEDQVRNSSDQDLMSEFEFHREMTQIFTSVRDLHTNYLLPQPFGLATAFVPFLIEVYFEGGRRRYLVTKLSDGFESPPFEAGVEVISWNGIPIARAVEINGDRFAGSNLEARRARGVATLTVRRLLLSLPPEEDFVIVGYRTQDGEMHELRTPWLVFSLPKEEGELTPPEPRNADLGALAAFGVDLEVAETNRAKKFIFRPNIVAAESRVARRLTDASEVRGGLEDLVPPSVMDGRAVDTPSGTFAYIRIRSFTFSNPFLKGEQIAQALVNRFLQLAETLPQEGLIIDVRGNGGGIIYAGERLLQLLTPHSIEPERAQFINAPLNLEICSRHSFLAPWVDSLRQSIRTGATFSRGFPITSLDSVNTMGQRYHGPVVVVTDAQCYSTTDIFAAGVQDHAIGPVLGVDGNTGAGGANVWGHDLFMLLYPPESGSPYKALPNGSGMRVAVRRTLRVRENAGTLVEDLGVVPDLRHEMTRDDLLDDNVDLINRAGEILADLPVRRLQARVTDQSAGQLKLVTNTLGITRLDVFVDGRPQGSIDIADGETDVEVPGQSPASLELKGFDNDELVAARKLFF